MVSRLNVVDGIFASQVGVLLVPAEFRLIPAGSEPFTASEAELLLAQLANYRQNTPEVRAAGLAHLFTGKPLDGGSTLGIAYIDSLCEAEFGVSLSSSEVLMIGQAVVMAHEIGHNFGAVHDGVPGVCAHEPQNMLMGPFYGGSPTFSQCSRDSIVAGTTRARGVCVGSPNYADVAVEAPTSTSADVDADFIVPFLVRSTGNREASNVTLEVLLGENLSLVGTSVANGSCNLQGVGIHCTLGNLAASESRVVELRFRGTQITQYNLRAAVQADNDFLVDDNEIGFQLNLRSAVDLALSLSAEPSSVYVGEPIDFTVDVVSTRSRTATGAQVDINLFSLTTDSFDAGPNNCQLESNALRCTLSDIAPGASTRITLRGHSDVPRADSVQANLLLSGDGDGGNNHRTVNVSVRAEQEVTVTPASREVAVVVGSSIELTHTITAAGRLPIPNVRFSIQPLPFTYGVIESITSGAGSCDSPSATTTMYCDFGDMNPGDIRTVVVRVRMDQIGTTHLSTRGEFFVGGVLRFGAANTSIHGSVGTDLSIGSHSAPAITEGQGAGGTVRLLSQGVVPAQNVVATLEVPAPLRLTQVGYSGPANLTCSLIDAQHARCTGAFTNAAFVDFNYQYTGDVPAEYAAEFLVTADGDSIADNNAVSFPIHVLPYLDAGVTTSESAAHLDLIVGEWRTVIVNVTTGARPVPAVRVVAADQFSPYEVDMSAPGYSCAREPFGMACDLGDQPAGASVPVTVRYRATTGNRQSSVTIGTSIARDSNPANDSINFYYTTMERTDIGVSVAQASVAGTNGSTLALPAITVTNPGAFGHGVVLEIPLPAFTTIQSVSSNTICSGTTILRCDFGLLLPNSSAVINLLLTTAGTGNFDSSITVRAINDSTPDNNAAIVNVRVNAAQGGGGGSSSGGGAGSSSGGGGGGGPLECFSLASLALLLRRRWKRTPST